MADFETNAITPPREEDAHEPSLKNPGLFLRQGLSYVAQMKAHTTPTTAVHGTGSGGHRPTVGLVWPR